MILELGNCCHESEHQKTAPILARAPRLISAHTATSEHFQQIPTSRRGRIDYRTIHGMNGIDPST